MLKDQRIFHFPLGDPRMRSIVDGTGRGQSGREWLITKRTRIE